MESSSRDPHKVAALIAAFGKLATQYGRVQAPDHATKRADLVVAMQDLDLDLAEAMHCFAAEAPVEPDYAAITRAVQGR